MTRHLLWILALALLLPAPALAQDGDEEAAEEEETGITAGLIEEDRRYGEIDRYYEDVATTDEFDVVDTAAAWRLENAVIEFDSLTLTLEDGEFFPRKAIDGEVYGGVYIGRGVWHFETDLELEQEEMERITKERVMHKEFSDAYFEFSPNYLERLQAQALPASGDTGVVNKAERFWKQSRKEFPNDFDYSIAYYHVEGLAYFDEIHITADLEKVKVVMDTNTGGRGTMGYTYDSTDREEVSLWRYTSNPMQIKVDSEGKTVYNINAVDVICHFPRQVDRENLTRRELAYKDASLFDIEHYISDFEIFQDTHSREWGLKGDVTVVFTPTLRDLRVIPLSLISWWTNYSAYTKSVEITAVGDGEGNPLPYVHKYHMLAVELPEAAQVGQQYRIRVRYQGEIIDAITQPDPEMSLEEASAAEATEQGMSIVNYTLLNTYPWFPQNGSNFWDRYTFEWSVTVPKPMLVASSGTLVEQQDLGDRYKFVVMENIPSALASVIFGRFSLIQDDPAEGKVPHVRVYAHAGQIDSAREILEQTHDILDYFAELYQAPYIYPELDIAQMPYNVGFAQAPPGLVQMDGVAYLSKTLLVNVYGVNNPFLREAFLPHEIAHQWWAHKVCSLTDHDYWMMEAGAEYSAALWGEASKGEKEYDTYVKYWLNRRAAKNTKWTTSVWMAATGRDANRRRQLATIYGRGPLLLHELRLSLGYQKIVSVLRAMLHEWDGQSFATEDFKMVLEKATGFSFDEYFERYVYRNEPLLGTVPEDVLPASGGGAE